MSLRTIMNAVTPILGWIVPIVISLSLVTFLYLRTRVRPATWVMRLIALFLTGIATLIAIVIGFSAELSVVGRGATRTEEITGVIVSVVVLLPITYGVFLLSDCAVVLARRVFPTRPKWLSVEYWKGQNLTLALVLLPIALFTAATILTSILQFYPVYSAITVDVIQGEMRLKPDVYKFTHPRVFHVKETTMVSVVGEGDSHTHITCTLDSPSFDIKPVDTQPVGMEYKSNGAYFSVPDCLWLITPKEAGNQQAILHVVAEADASKSLGRYPVAVEHPQITNFEILTVSSPLFTFPNLVAFVGFISAVFGLLRSTKPGADKQESKEPVAAEESEKKENDVEVSENHASTPDEGVNPEVVAR